MSILGDAVRASRLLAAMPSLIRAPLDCAQARQILGTRLRRREERFLELLARSVYACAASPYRRLLERAGCELGDVERMVRRDGLEPALEALFRAGVYLTLDELKGRRDMERGGETVATGADIANPAVSAQLVYRTSGSGGAPGVVPLDVRHHRARAVNQLLSLEARNGLEWRHALWLVPGGAAASTLLTFVALGRPFERWFSQLDPAGGGMGAAYSGSERLLRWGGRLGGMRLPRPLWVPGERAEIVARWMREQLEEGRTPHLMAFPSAAARVGYEAVGAGIDLNGARFSIGGEPVTGARLAAIRKAGAEAVPHYGAMEAGIFGEGCLRPEADDEIHLFDDLHAMISVVEPVGDLPTGALLVTSLDPQSPLVLLNACLGDRGVLDRRRCGCALETVGWKSHLHSVRSFEKLTAAGMCLHDCDAVRVLEEVLPARFGGGPHCYQLAEGEDGAGRACLELVVSPEVGELDERALGEAFLAAVGAGTGAARITELLWREEGLVRVARRAPGSGATGKVLHLQVRTEKAI